LLHPRSDAPRNGRVLSLRAAVWGGHAAGLYCACSGGGGGVTTGWCAKALEPGSRSLFDASRAVIAVHKKPYTATIPRGRAGVWSGEERPNGPSSGGGVAPLRTIATPPEILVPESEDQTNCAIGRPRSAYAAGRRSCIRDVWHTPVRGAGLTRPCGVRCGPLIYSKKTFA